MTFFLILLAYSWCIYPVVVLTTRFCLSVVEFKERMPVIDDSGLNPSVSIVVPVFNGENMIESKIKNCLDQEYRGQFDIIIVSDCSSDRTPELVLSFKEEKVNFI